MRSEIGVTPWAKWFMVTLNGEELRHCRMADEEQGCAEVYQVDEQGIRHPEWGTRMVWGKIALVPLVPQAQVIKDHPEDAQSVWNQWQREMEQRFYELEKS